MIATSVRNIKFSVMDTGNFLSVCILVLACLLEQGETNVMKMSFCGASVAI